jgi:hypothetical protein
MVGAGQERRYTDNARLKTDRPVPAKTSDRLRRQRLKMKEVFQPVKIVIHRFFFAIKREDLAI